MSFICSLYPDVQREYMHIYESIVMTAILSSTKGSVMIRASILRFAYNTDKLQSLELVYSTACNSNSPTIELENTSGNNHTNSSWCKLRLPSATNQLT